MNSSGHSPGSSSAAHRRQLDPGHTRAKERIRLRSITPAPAAPSEYPSLIPRQGFWRRKVLHPIRTQLTQGVSPDQIAATLAVGTACSLFPIFGVTSLVNLGVGLSLRMNQPVLQALNQLLGPVQVALSLVYVRFGELIWRSSEHQLTLSQMMREYRERALWDFLQQFSWAGVHALTAWVITSPILIGALYFALRPMVRRTARLKANTNSR